MSWNPSASSGSSSRIVVTGGSGRLGVSVANHLAARGHEVVSLDRAPSELVHDGVRQLAVDLTDAAATRTAFERLRPDGVVHLAAIAVPFSAPEDVILRTNAQLCLSVLTAAADAGAGRALVASSPTVLGYGAPQGWAPEYLPIDEEHPIAPWNAYALSKATMEATVRMFVAARGDAFRVGAFRPCFVISPQEWHGAPTQQGHTVAERLACPELAAVSLFNYVDARDAAGFTERWLEGAHEVPNGEVFFVGADDAMARAPLAELVPQYFPGTERIAEPLTGTQAAFSSAKALRLLGWRPQRSWRTELAGEPLATTSAHLS
ncbi:nucleoside-diphosphate-sugar epimerase [Sinomonas cyclohexanicum]|uniref:Nucleoside-diphosphate-sugar epimerase n=1 Tax=Sinomonas cyclohexanicum TaxID=322009 RepID=A0ABN6FKN2_SINCY|nr:NAD(P)-dependent oxidoreductase [Corynebacterium cyclohexanicum]BCT77422.1 nucleoside-diphosphate-sugar epimerase [Corynebacterium cyclohexanicum]